MPGNAPAVMVSSTFYDLRQIRADLMDFIQDDLGYRPLLSEYASFPIDPDADTIENCRRRVEQDADVLVLVIGGRYGYVDAERNRSVTNLEYLAARAKGIPIYAFVDKNVTAVLPVWKANPEADFSATLDNVKLFEFVQDVMSADSVWTRPFERAQEINTSLRFQFAHLMMEGLRWNMRLRREPQPVLRRLGGDALRLALERPEMWEHRLFAQVLTDGIEAHGDLRREHRLGLLLGAGERVTSKAGSWMKAQIRELGNIVTSANTLMNVALPEAFRPDGTPGDVTEIVFVAERLASVYHHAIDWSLRLRRAHVDDLFKPAVTEMAAFSDDIIESMEQFGPYVLREIEEALVAPGDGTRRQIVMTLTFRLSNAESYQQEMIRLESMLG